MLCHFFVLPTEVSSVQVAPESAEVQMFPPSATAASLVPSLEEVMLCQSFVLPTEVRSVQVAALAPERSASTEKKRSQIFIFRVAICPRDARPNRSTPDLSRPCELDAGFRVCRSRPCLLLAHQVSADSVRFDRPALSRCVPMGPVLCQKRKRDARQKDRRRISAARES